MKEEQYHVELDKYDQKIMLNALNTLRNNQVKEQRPTDPVDELIIKVSEAPQRRSGLISRRCHEER